MNNNYQTLFIFFCIFFACQTSQKETVKKWYGKNKKQLKEKYQVIKKEDTSLKDGTYKVFYKDGGLKEKAEYKKGKLEGKRRLYYKNDQLFIEETHKDGKFHGPYKKYYKDGTLKEEGQYDQNDLTGVWKYYYKSGQLEERVNYKEGEEHGSFKAYYEVGSLKTKGQFKHGKKSGNWQYYYPSGTLQVKGKYEEGYKKATEINFDSTGEKTQKVIFRNQEPKDIKNYN